MKKGTLNTYLLTNTITFVKYLKSFEEPLILLTFYLYRVPFISFPWFYHSFVYVNVFSSGRDTCIHLVLPREQLFSGEK